MPRRRKQRPTIAGIEADGPTVQQYQAQQAVKLLEAGIPKREVEATIGTSLASLRNSGALTGAVRRLLIEATDVKDPSSAALVGRSRLLELALQDDDIKVAVSAAKKLADSETQTIGTQNNINVAVSLANPDIVRMLESLGLVKPAPVIEAEVVEVTDSNKENEQ